MTWLLIFLEEDRRHKIFEWMLEKWNFRFFFWKQIRRSEGGALEFASHTIFTLSLDVYTACELPLKQWIHLMYRTLSPEEKDINHWSILIYRWSRITWICCFLGSENSEIVHLLGQRDFLSQGVIKSKTRWSLWR